MSFLYSRTSAVRMFVLHDVNRFVMTTIVALRNVKEYVRLAKVEDAPL